MRMNDILKNNRICPNPQKWNKLWEILKLKSEEKVFSPLILAAWWHTSDGEKQERFQYHLSIAEKCGAIDEVMSFWESLNESDWHHKGE